MEVAIDERVSGEEILSLFRRFEPLHLPFSTSCRPMRGFGAVVQKSALSMFDVGEDLMLCRAVAFQLVSHDHPRHVLQALQQPLEETLRRLRVAAALNEDVEHDAVLIHGTPEIMLLALDPDEHLVQVPYVDGPLPARCYLLSAR
jgi:hypothetical protein